MHGLQTGSHTSAWVTAGVHDVLAIMVLGLVQQSLQTRLSERPGTSIKGLLLAPNDGLGVGIHVQILLQLLPGEGVKLLDASDSGVLEAIVGTVLVQRGIDLTGTEDDAVDLLWIIDSVTVLWVRDNPLELGVSGELFYRRAGKRVTKKRLREEDNES